MTKEKAMEVAERLRQNVASKSIKTDAGELEQTASIGLAVFPENGRALEELIGKADQALYAAKSGGRNKVEVCTK